jgi:hypothetical protein
VSSSAFCANVLIYRYRYSLLIRLNVYALQLPDDNKLIEAQEGDRAMASVWLLVHLNTHRPIRQPAHLPLLGCSTAVTVGNISVYHKERSKLYAPNFSLFLSSLLLFMVLTVKGELKYIYRPC